MECKKKYKLKYIQNRTDSQILKKKLWLPKGKGKVGETNQMYVIDKLYKINKQQGYTVKQKEFYPLSFNNL